MIIQEMDLEIKHRSGKSNSNADALSRNPLPANDHTVDLPANQPAAGNSEVPQSVSDNKDGQSELKLQQREDRPSLSPDYYLPSEWKTS